MADALHGPMPAAAKMAVVTRPVPVAHMAALGDAAGDPEVGDLVAGQVLALGKHTAVENRDSRRVTLFVGDVVVGAYGNRYATDQFEGYVGPRAELVHMLSIGGVCGQVRSKNDLMQAEPTLLKFLGFVRGRNGRKLNLKAYGMTPAPMPSGRPRTVLVVGASMNSGKTTVAASTVRGLTACGYRAAAAKITGTASSKDTWFMYDAGAVGVHDFVDCGYPSTYLLSLPELKRIHRTVLSRLMQREPDVVVLEVADGLFQRETRMLLTDPEFRGSVDHVVFAGVDSLSAESGARHLASWGYKVAATSGLASCSSLGIDECEAAVPGVPCLNALALATGQLLPRIGLLPRVEPAGVGAGGLGEASRAAAESARLSLVRGLALA